MRHKICNLVLYLLRDRVSSAVSAAADWEELMRSADAFDRVQTFLPDDSVIGLVAEQMEADRGG